MITIRITRNRGNILVSTTHDNVTQRASDVGRFLDNKAQELRDEVEKFCTQNDLEANLVSAPSGSNEARKKLAKKIKDKIEGAKSDGETLERHELESYSKQLKKLDEKLEKETEEHPQKESAPKTPEDDQPALSVTVAGFEDLQEKKQPKKASIEGDLPTRAVRKARLKETLEKENFVEGVDKK